MPKWRYAFVVLLIGPRPLDPHSVIGIPCKRVSMMMRCKQDVRVESRAGQQECLCGLFKCVLQYVLRCYPPAPPCQFPTSMKVAVLATTAMALLLHRGLPLLHPLARRCATHRAVWRVGASALERPTRPNLCLTRSCRARGALLRDACMHSA